LGIDEKTTQTNTEPKTTYPFQGGAVFLLKKEVIRRSLKEE
jgi:hypothetical protein